MNQNQFEPEEREEGEFLIKLSIIRCLGAGCGPCPISVRVFHKNCPELVLSWECTPEILFWPPTDEHPYRLYVYYNWLSTNVDIQRFKEGEVDCEIARLKQLAMDAALEKAKDILRKLRG